jgi:tetratricopeptide (TPR) repeat protein
MKTILKKSLTILLSLTLVLFSLTVYAGDERTAVSNERPAASDESTAAMQRLQTHWAKANYQKDEKAKALAFEELLRQVEFANQQFPQHAEILIWSGIIKSTYAGVKGGMGALKFAKAAKADLEQSLALDPTALQGSAYTSLGTLYYKVPGWPIGFGDEKKAEVMLKKALSLNPNGIDPNYFYGDFLVHQHQQHQASQYFHRALSAAPRPGRELADEGRRAEIHQALFQLNEKL